MIFGPCPYCDETIHISMPDTPRFYKDTCESCGKKFFRWCSRVDPWSMTLETFELNYIVDEQAKTIKVRPDGPVDLRERQWAEWKANPVTRALIDQAVAQMEDELLNGTGEDQECVGIFSHNVIAGLLDEIYERDVNT